MKRLLWLAMVVSTPALAAPTYLKCTFGDFPVELTVDESASQVTAFMPTTGHSAAMRANFGPEIVIFGDNVMSYRLSRVDLSITRTARWLNETVTGQCGVAATPKRAF